MPSLPSRIPVTPGWYAVAPVPAHDSAPEKVDALGTVLTVASIDGAALVVDSRGQALTVREEFGLVFVHAHPATEPLPDGTAVPSGKELELIAAAWPTRTARPGSVYDVDVPWDVPVSDFVNPQHTEPVHLTVSEPWQAVPGEDSFVVTWSGSAPYVNLAPGRRWCLRVHAETRYDLWGPGAALLRITAPALGITNWIAQFSTPVDSGRCRLFFAYHAAPRQVLLRRLVPSAVFTFFVRRVIQREVAKDLAHWHQMGTPGYAYGPLPHDSDLLMDWLARPAAGAACTLGRPVLTPAQKSA